MKKHKGLYMAIKFVCFVSVILFICVLVILYVVNKLTLYSSIYYAKEFLFSTLFLCLLGALIYFMEKIFNPIYEEMAKAPMIGDFIIGYVIVETKTGGHYGPAEITKRKEIKDTVQDLKISLIKVGNTWYICDGKTEIGRLVIQSILKESPPDPNRNFSLTDSEQEEFCKSGSNEIRFNTSGGIGRTVSYLTDKNEWKDITDYTNW